MSDLPQELFATYAGGEKEDTEGFLLDYAKFMSVLTGSFGDQLGVHIAEQKLHFLKQKGTIEEYITKFIQLQAQVDWNDAAFISQFKFGFSGPVQEVMHGQWSSLTTLQS